MACSWHNSCTRFLIKIRLPYFHTQNTIFFPSKSTNPPSLLLSKTKQQPAGSGIAFYQDRTKPFRQSPLLFLSTVERLKGTAVCKQCLSKWMLQCIHLSHHLHNRQPPPGTQAHSTWSLATSIAFLNVFKAATWASADTFSHLCVISHDIASDALLRHTVLSSVLIKPQPSN